MQDPRFADIIEQDFVEAQTLGVRKTPQLFVNGKALTSLGFLQLKKLSSAELARQ